MAMFGRPMAFEHGDPGDDARSVSSVASASSYMDSLHPPLTARLPPAVRARPSTVGAQRGLSHVPDRRLSQLEAKLRELEMEDWRTDRLIFAASAAGKPDLPPRRAAPASGLRYGSAAGAMAHDVYDVRPDRSEARQQVPEPARQPAAGEHREGAGPWHDALPSRRTRRGHDGEQSATHMPGHAVHPERLGELPHTRPGTNYSFGSPFSFSEPSMLQTPGYMPARPAHHLFSGTPGAHTKFEELSAIRNYAQDLSSSTSGTASRRQPDRLREKRFQEPDGVYSLSPEVMPHGLVASPPNEESARAAINFYDFKHAPSPIAPVSSGSASSERWPVLPSAPAGLGLAKPRAHQDTVAEASSASDGGNRKRVVDEEIGGKIEPRNGWNNEHTSHDASSGDRKARETTHFSSASELSPGGIKMTHMLQNSNDNKIELAQQLLDHLLGQYFKKSGTFRALASAATRTDVPTDVVWIRWWPEVEREVRLAIKPEMKAVYDSRCSDLFSSSKQALQQLFDKAPRSPSTGPERKLTLESIQKCAAAGTWALLASQCDVAALAAIGDGEPMTWEVFWPQVESEMKAGVKDYMRKVIKDEILAKFTEWRRRFHEVFTSVDPEGSGTAPASSYVQALEESNLGMMLGMYSSPSAKRLMHQASNNRALATAESAHGD